MRAAAKRRASLQAELTEAVFIAQRHEPKQVQQYCDALRGIDRTLPPEALPGVMAQASRELPQKTWQEFLAERNS